MVHNIGTRISQHFFLFRDGPSPPGDDRPSMTKSGIGPCKFSSQIDEALSLSHTPDYLIMIDAIARQNKWESRARLILDALE